MARDFLTPGCTVLTEGLACFNSVADVHCHHDVIVTGGLKPRDLSQLLWGNTLLSNLTTRTAGAYHVFKFNKYAHPYLSAGGQNFSHTALRPEPAQHMHRVVSGIPRAAPYSAS